MEPTNRSHPIATCLDKYATSEDKQQLVQTSMLSIATCLVATCLDYTAPHLVQYTEVYYQSLHYLSSLHYGVATISRMLKNICLFAECRSLLQVSFAKETYIFKHPTNRSHPIVVLTTRLHLDTHRGAQHQIACLHHYTAPVCLLLFFPTLHHTSKCGVATVRRIDKIIGLFCKRAL